MRNRLGTEFSFVGGMVGGRMWFEFVDLEADGSLVSDAHDASADDAERVELSRQRIIEFIESGGPLIATQPIVELATGRVFAHEALSRFPEVGWTTEEWFLEASAVGLGRELEASAIRAALAIVQRLPAGSALTINVSADSLCAPDILALFDQTFSSQLIVELTEHAAIQVSPTLGEALATIRAAGVQIAIDDVGSGYAGLQRIVRIQPEVLKLDRMLITGVSTDTVRQTLVEAMVWFCSRSGTTLVAEGVEEEADLDALRRLGVTHAQGYLLARPSLEFDPTRRPFRSSVGVG